MTSTEAPASESDSIDITAAVVAERGAEFTMQRLRTEPLRADEILVGILATGVCQTDAHSRNQDLPVPLPAVLGHEGAGIVTAVGSQVSRVAPGDHVVLTFPSCGHCPGCLAGEPANCARSFELSFGCIRDDGTSAYADTGVAGHFFGQSSFANFARGTERNVVKIADDIPLHLAAPLGCGIQTGVGAVLNSLQMPAGSSVLVTGTGAVGLSAIMGAAIANAQTIIAVDLNDERLALARELGATHTINGHTDDLAARVREICPDGVDFALEITAVPQLLALAVEVLAPRGTAGLVGGAPAGTTAAIDMNRLLNGGRHLRGIAQGDSEPHSFIPRLIDFWRSGRLPLERLVRTYDFSQINHAFADAAQGVAIKPVLTQSDD